MGSTHSTYHAFGVHVPESEYQTGTLYQETDWLDSVIHATPKLAGTDLGYLTAGDYDRDMLFLTMSRREETLEVSLGQFMVLSDVDITGRAELIKLLAKTAGYTNLAEPSWLVIPDVS